MSALDDILPQNSGFLKGYVQYASACSDAPEHYHLGVGATILSAAVGKRLGCPWMAGRKLLPNLYTVLVGPSRTTRKTGSMDAGIDLLQGADPSLVCPIPGSYEEMIAGIRKKPEGLLTYREFGHFLKTTQKGYGEPIRTVLMDLFDWPPDRAFTRNLKKGATIIEPPICLSLLAGVSTDLLFSYADLEDWVGGFFGRFLILYGERGEFRMPKTWEAAHTYLITVLHQFVNWQFGECGGFSPAAWTGFEEWAKWRDGESHKAPPRVQTFIAGTPTLAAKMALLFATDVGEPAAGAGWLVSVESMWRAIQFVERLYIPSIFHVGDKLTTSEWERHRQRVVDVVDAHPLGITRRDLLRRTKLPTDGLDQIVGTLKEEGTITQGQDATRGIVYRKAPADSNGSATVLPFSRPAAAATP